MRLDFKLILENKITWLLSQLLFTSCMSVELSLRFCWLILKHLMVTHPVTLMNCCSSMSQGAALSPRVVTCWSESHLRYKGGRASTLQALHSGTPARGSEATISDMWQSLHKLHLCEKSLLEFKWYIVLQSIYLILLVDYCWTVLFPRI